MRGYRPISEDLSELVRLLNSRKVEFIIVGAHALAFHGVPRFTEDIDFFLARTEANIEKLSLALEEFGVTLPPESRKDLLTKDRGILFVGQRPNRADFLNFLSGVNFESAHRTKVAGLLAGEPVFFLSIEDYVATKKASGRPKDAGDLAMLRSVHPELDL